MAEPLPSKQKTRVRFSPSAPYRHVRLAAEDPGPSNRVARVRIPHVAPIVLPLRLAGRAPGFDLGGLGSNSRGAATSNGYRGIAQSVERRFHTPRQPQNQDLATGVDAQDHGGFILISRNRRQWMRAHCRHRLGTLVNRHVGLAFSCPVGLASLAQCSLEEELWPLSRCSMMCLGAALEILSGL